MTLLQHHRLPGIGCSNILARARSQCLAAASHAPSLPVLLHVNGSRQAHLVSRKTGINAISLSGRSRRQDLCIVAEASAAAANVTPSTPRGISVSDVLWPSAGESQALMFFSIRWFLWIFIVLLPLISEMCCPISSFQLYLPDNKLAENKTSNLTCFPLVLISYHAGAFLAMAVLGKMDQLMAFKGVSLTIAPLGAVCAVLFTAPDSPALFLMIAAASLPLLFIDGPKFHNLQFWYALFPGAAGCAILCLIVS